jgi:hypothetical protein
MKQIIGQNPPVKNLTGDVINETPRTYVVAFETKKGLVTEIYPKSTPLVKSRMNKRGETFFNFMTQLKGMKFSKPKFVMFHRNFTTEQCLTFKID